jgi:hypothetical protein
MQPMLSSESTSFILDNMGRLLCNTSQEVQESTGITLLNHPTAEDLTRRVAAFEARINQDPCHIADRLWVKLHLNQEKRETTILKLDGV